MKAKCGIDGCDSTFIPHGRKRYCSPECKTLARNAVSKKSKLKHTLLGRRLAYLIDHEERIGHTEPPLTASEWRGEPAISNQPNIGATRDPRRP